MTRALVTQLVEVLDRMDGWLKVRHLSGLMPDEIALTKAAREYLATEPSGERAELIKKLRWWASVVSGNETCGRAADMLEADAQKEESTHQRESDYEAGYHYGFDRGLAQQGIKLRTQLARRTVERDMAISMIGDCIDAQQSKRAPMTPQEIRDWWASENKLEDCDMCKLHDFETVVRAVEERHGITPAQKPTDWSAA